MNKPKSEPWSTARWGLVAAAAALTSTAGYIVYRQLTRAESSDTASLRTKKVARGREQKQVAVPDQFQCPITKDMMREPYSTADGHTYERKAIQRWLRSHATSPRTGETLGDKTLRPNHALRSQISEFCATHGLPPLPPWEPEVQLVATDPHVHPQAHAQAQVHAAGGGAGLPPFSPSGVGLPPSPSPLHPFSPSPNHPPISSASPQPILQQRPSGVASSPEQQQHLMLRQMQATAQMVASGFEAAPEVRQHVSSALARSGHSVHPNDVRGLIQATMSNPSLLDLAGNLLERHPASAPIVRAFQQQLQQLQQLQQQAQVAGQEQGHAMASRQQHTQQPASSLSPGPPQSPFFSPLPGGAPFPFPGSASVPGGAPAGLPLGLPPGMPVPGMPSGMPMPAQSTQLPAAAAGPPPPVFQAAACGDVASTELLLDRDPGALSVVSPEGMTLLHVACWNQHLDVVRMLLAKHTTTDSSEAGPGASSGRRKLDLHCLSWNRSTPLHYAAWKGSADIVAALLEAGADPTRRMQDGDSALHQASWQGKIAAAKLLIERGNADVHAVKDDGSTPLHLAAQRGNDEMVALLLEHGADPGAQNSQLLAPLNCAAAEGHSHAARLLLRAGARAAHRIVSNENAAHQAAAMGFKDVLTALMDASEACSDEAIPPLPHPQVSPRALDIANAVTAARPQDGCTPLHLAVMRGDCECAEIILNRQRGSQPASIRQARNDQSSDVGGVGDTAPNAVAADLSARDKQGFSPLHSAIWYYNNQAAAPQEPTQICPCGCLLVEAGAPLDARSNNGSTPLHLAAWKGLQQIVVQLLDAGADVSAQMDDGDSPLHQAAYGNHGVIVLQLLAKGANVHARKHDGNTALHLAAARGLRDMVQLLLDGGADRTLTNHAGFKPLDLARQFGNQHAVELLECGTQGS